MNPIEWTRKLSARQLAVIANDEREQVDRYPDYNADHVFNSIKTELDHRQYEKEKADMRKQS